MSGWGVFPSYIVSRDVIHKYKQNTGTNTNTGTYTGTNTTTGTNTVTSTTAGTNSYKHNHCDKQA